MCATAVLGLVAPAAAADRCGKGPQHPGRAENLIVDVRATKTTCRTARQVAGRYRDRSSRTPLGFTCRSTPGEAEATVRCKRGARVVTFRLIVF
ncbi:hypothetical protein [Paraconexibacter sp. AEG42_29]|uniref:hypothetical protein n=1 Tax=Paraconexibacter sp. AEG42_29 TaxID=2997339 RepID=UPI00339D32FF